MSKDQLLRASLALGVREDEPVETLRDALRFFVVEWGTEEVRPVWRIELEIRAGRRGVA